MDHLANFSVSGNAKIFNLLTKHLYSQPLPAAIREAGTNAIDANRENKIDCSIHPVEITVSGGRNGELVLLKFTDRGIGIDPDRMSRFVSQLGTSSKRGDTTQNGTFGIGMLSILNVSTQFAIQTTTICDGELKSYSYIVFIGTNGVPTFTQSQVESTQQATGSTVSFPLKQELLADVLMNVVDVWGASDCVEIYSAIGTATIAHNSTERARKAPLFHQLGIKLVGSGSDLKGCLPWIVPVVKVGDVIYPAFGVEDRFYELLSSRDDLRIGSERNQLVKRLIPPESLNRFESIWKYIFNTAGRMPCSIESARRLRSWHQNKRAAAILFLEFSKGEIELTASREGLAATADNCLKVVERMILAISEIIKQIEAQFLEFQTAGEPHKAMMLAKGIPGFDRIAFAPDLSYKIIDLSRKRRFLHNLGWTTAEQMPYTMHAIETEWLDLVWLLFKRQSVQSVRVIIVFGSIRQLSAAALVRATGTKICDLGFFMAISVLDIAAAEELIATYHLRELGHCVELLAAQAAPRKSSRAKISPLTAIVAAPESPLLEIESIRAMAAEIDSIVQSFLPAVPGTIEGNRSRGLKSWYLPTTASTTRIEIAFYCVLAAELGIDGRLFFHHGGADTAFYEDLPDARNLLSEIIARTKAYLATIDPKCRQIGFIPGVDPDWVWLTNTLNSEVFEPQTSDLLEKIVMLGTGVERTAWATIEAQSAIDFSFSSRRLNRLIFQYWHLLDSDREHANLTRLFVAKSFASDPVDDQYGEGVLKLLLDIVALQFPLVNLCYGIPAAEASGLTANRWISESTIARTLLLLNISLPNL